MDLPYDELDTESLQQLLEAHRMNLKVWVEQTAKHGSLQAPSNLVHQISDSKNQIKAIRSEIDTRKHTSNERKINTSNERRIENNNENHIDNLIYIYRDFGVNIFNNTNKAMGVLFIILAISAVIVMINVDPSSPTVHAKYLALLLGAIAISIIILGFIYHTNDYKYNKMKKKVSSIIQDNEDNKT